MGKRLALIIGNSVYRDPTLARLKAPEADVGALAEILQDPEIGAFEDAKVLMNVSSTAVRRAISDFFTRKNKEDLLLLYFTGHGVLDERGHLYLAVKDTEPGLLRGTAIPASFITEEMDNSYSQRQILVLDCCHSGAFARGSKGVLGASVGTASAFEGTGYGRVVITATDATQYAWEGDQVLGDAQNSLFTHFLVEGLQSGQADSDHDGTISVDELFDYVYKNVVKATPKQTPGRWSFKEQGEIIIAQALHSKTDQEVKAPSPNQAEAEFDEELKQRLDKLYTKGLSAYWLEKWDQAVSHFSALVEQSPGYQDAQSKLEEAKRQLRLSDLYQKGQSALESGDLNEAVSKFEELVGEAPQYKDASGKLETARSRRQLAELYDEARQLTRANQWQAVVNIFERIHSLQADYADPESLLAHARQELRTLQLRSQVEQQYNQALQAMNRGDWGGAQHLLRQVINLDANYEDAQQLLARVESELARRIEVKHGEEEKRTIVTPVSPATPTGKPISRRKFILLAAGGVAGVVVTGLLIKSGSAPKATTPALAPTSAPTKPPRLVPSETSSQSSQATTVPAEPTQTIAPRKVERLNTAWPLGDVPRNRTLVLGSQSSQQAGKFNPFEGVFYQNGSDILYEPCAYYAAQTGKLTLWLAESYSVNADGTVWQINFRKGIQWSDGTPFTANDVASSMERLKRVSGLQGSFTYGNEFQAAEVIDDLTLKVNLTRPDWRFFHNSLTFCINQGDVAAIQPEHIYKTISDDQLIKINVYDMAKGWPVSTGPYGVGLSTDQQTNFDLRPSWWAVESGFVEKYPDVVRFQAVTVTDETTATQKLVSKEFDQTSINFRPQAIASMLAQRPLFLTTWTGKEGTYGYPDDWPLSVQFCTAKPPWDNPKVRWAVSYAIDRKKLIDSAWNGAGRTANSPFADFKVLNDYMAGIQDLTSTYNVLEFDPEKSKALMNEAGFVKDSSGYWVDSSGKRPDANLYADNSYFGDLAPVIADMLRSAGFDCAHQSPNDVWLASVDGRASLFLWGHSGGLIDPLGIFQLYRKANSNQMGNSSWGNVTRWWNDETERIAEEAARTPLGDPKMKDLFKAWMEQYYINLPDAPIVQLLVRIPVSKWYWDNWPTEENPYMGSALYHKTAAVVVTNLRATLGPVPLP